MPIFIRPRSQGNAFELRVTHERLERPKYATKDTREAAEALPHGYSGYTADDVSALAALGKDPPEDCERNRRIDPEEEQQILAVLHQRHQSAETLEQRAEAEGLLLMFELALQTAMRMREIYTLTMDQIPTCYRWLKSAA